MTGSSRRSLAAVTAALLGIAAAPELALAESTVRQASHADETFFSIEYRPDTARTRHLVLALDTSRSVAGPRFSRASTLVAQLARSAPTSSVVRLVHGDVETHRCPSTVEPCLTGIEPGGASDLGALLRRAVAEAGRLRGPTSIVLITDGSPSLGERDPDALIATTRRLIGGRDIAVHTVAVDDTPVADDDPAAILLKQQAHGLAGAHFTRPDASLVAPVVRHAMITDIQVSIVSGQISDLVGSEREHLPVRKGFFLAGRLDSKRARLRLRGRIAGQRIQRVIAVDPRRAQPDDTLVTRWANAAIAELEAQDTIDYDSIAEIESTYLPRRNSGTLRRRRVARPVIPRIGCGARMTGDRDKNMIRRRIRQRHDQIRHCYQKRLLRDHRLAGEIRVGFTIAADGSVHEPYLASSSIGSHQVEQCVLDVVRSIRFSPVPLPSYWTQVNYPFTLRAPLDVDEDDTLLAWRARVDQQLADGDTVGARRLLDRRMREIADNQLGHDALLPLLRSSKARRAFPQAFERAARARLALGHMPMDLLVDLFQHMSSRPPAEVIALFGTQEFTSGTGARMLTSLITGNRHGLALALGRAWRQAHGDEAVYQLLGADSALPGRLPQLMFETGDALLTTGDTRDRVMDDFLAAANRLGTRERGMPHVLGRCTTLEGQRDACTRWLNGFHSYPAARRRLAGLYRPVVAKALAERRNHPEDNYADIDLAEAIAHTGDMAGALRALSELLEIDPTGYEAYAFGLIRLREDQRACPWLKKVAKDEGRSLKDVLEEAYSEAWGTAPPLGICQR